MSRHILSGWRFRALIFVMILAILGYGAAVLWSGWDAVSHSVSRVGVTGISVALIFSFTSYILRYFRWIGFLSTLNHHIPFWRGFRIYLSGFSMAATPGKAGENLRSVFMVDEGVSYRESFGMFLAERMSDLIALALISLTGIFLYADGRPAILLILFILICLLYALQKKQWLVKFEQFLNRVLPDRFAHSVDFIIDTIIAFRSCFKMRSMLIATLLGVLGWGIEGCGLYLFSHFLGYDLSLYIFLFIFAFSLLVGAITFLPGGLGATDLTMLNLLFLQGIALTDATAMTVVFRLCTLWFAIILGLLMLPFSRIRVT